MQISPSMVSCVLHISSHEFVKKMTRINISLDKKTDVKYGQAKFTMSQAWEYHNRYITILDIHSDDNLRSKRENQALC